MALYARGYNAKNKIVASWRAWKYPIHTKGNARRRRVRFNHQTFPALGCLYAGHYYKKYYHSPTGQKWLDIAANTFDLQIATDKPHCDCNSYQWLTLIHTIRYSLATQNLACFENGNARKNADYAILTMNNWGRGVAYGDLGNWTYSGNEAHILRIAEWFYRDGRALWAIDRKAEVARSEGLMNYETRVAKPARPDELLGVVPWRPVPELWYDSFLAKSGLEQSETFDKVAFREGWGNDDAYLLLDGLAVGGHGRRQRRGRDGHHLLLVADGQSRRLQTLALPNHPRPGRHRRSAGGALPDATTPAPNASPRSWRSGVYAAAVQSGRLPFSGSALQGNHVFTVS